MSASDAIRKIADAMVKHKDEFEITSLKTLEGEMKYRIHTKGQSTNGSRIGPYRAKWHIANRKAKGLQVGYKDLQYTGDLIRNYRVGRSAGKNVLGFLNDRARLKAEQNEDLVDKDIFTPSQNEISRLIDAYIKQLFKRIRRVDV